MEGQSHQHPRPQDDPGRPVAVVRRVKPDDYEALYDLYSQPGVIRGTLQMPFPSMEVWRERASGHTSGFYNLVATIDERPVGQLGLQVPANPRRAHTGSIGMAVHDAWQGRGVGSALMTAALDLADRWLNLSRIELQVFVDNEPALRLYRRTGFEVEGRLVAFALRDGTLADVFAMARLRSDL